MSDNATVADRIEACIQGLCAGDGMSWPAWWHRTALLPPRRSVRLAEASQHARDSLTTSIPTPYLQSSPPSSVDPAGPTDDAEWFVVAVRHHLGQLVDGSAADGDNGVWAELAGLRANDPGSVRGRIGTLIALTNLDQGLQPPASGNDNPHYFDDIACVRGVAGGLLRPGVPAQAAAMAANDAAVTHADDGVLGGRASAALVAELVSGAGIEAATKAARAELPAGSWCAHVVAECLQAVEPGMAPLDLAARLERTVVDHVYAFANQAPETLGLLLAHLAAATDRSTMLLGALAHPRHADALVPLAGAVAGLVWGSAVERQPLPELLGTCVRGLHGLPMREVVDTIVASQEKTLEGGR
ncbi:MAG: ADP-ribosylglycohydrolase family protein [Streptosporangiales bacterium]